MIASHLPGRTDNEIKNYWNSHLSRKIYSFQRVSNTDQSTVSGILDIIPPKRKCGRTSRWAMKKNKSHTTQNDSQRPKQTETTSTQPYNNEPAVQLPSTPSLDSEILPNAMIERTFEQCFDGANETNDDVLGSGVALSFVSDLMDLEREGRGVLSLNEEIENDDVACVGEERENDDVACNEDPAESSTTVSVNVSGDLYSSASFDWGLELDNDWDWESLIELNNEPNNVSEANLEHKENLLSWLWENDDWENDCMKLGDVDPQKQNDMLDWFLS